MDSLNPADVILFHRSTFFNWAIRKITGSKWGHVGIVIGNGKYIDSNPGGVKVKYLRDIDDEFIKVMRHDKISSDSSERVVSDIMELEGYKYDWKAIPLLLWALLRGRRGAPRIIGDKYKFICSELVAKGFYDNNLPVVKKYRPDEIIPEDFSRSRFFSSVEIIEN